MWIELILIDTNCNFLAHQGEVQFSCSTTSSPNSSSSMSAADAATAAAAAAAAAGLCL